MTAEVRLQVGVAVGDREDDMLSVGAYEEDSVRVSEGDDVGVIDEVKE